MLGGQKMITEETILLFRRDMMKDPPDMGYSKEIVEALVDEIIRLKRQMEITRMDKGE
jgi:hypothetical protein